MHRLLDCYQGSLKYHYNAPPSAEEPEGDDVNPAVGAFGSVVFVRATTLSLHSVCHYELLLVLMLVLTLSWILRLLLLCFLLLQLAPPLCAVSRRRP